MSPTVTGAKMNDEAILEAEIQQELEMINLDAENPQDGDAGLLEVDRALPENIDHVDDPESLPNIEDYLICMRNQTDRFEQELLECDDLLNHHPAGISVGFA
ncbi:uncharacterized protein LOC121381798 [Gigantopelta aegis]|uniref:uncharacterized protein LOC121381798 n=1 Tax=Gigantopelta aegis TaxID=1735272 RepID=UPI001B88E3EB|nr:uncharacterized protein LOC121381798 [Gigantopelta aegis]